MRARGKLMVASAAEEVNVGSDYTAEELAFLRAIDRYKRTRQRPFPTWREVLAVVHSLGYRKVEEAVSLPSPVGPQRSNR